MSPEASAIRTRYEARAEECRAIAESLRDRSCRETLMRVAESWQQMASKAELLAA